MSDTYNGWTNWVTWNVHLWLTNEEPAYRLARREARVIVRDSRDPKDLRDFVADMYGLPTSGLAADLIGAELDDVDWDEIVAALVED